MSEHTTLSKSGRPFHEIEGPVKSVSSSARAQAKDTGNTSMVLASPPSGGFSSGDSG